jgi:hypothetical protein
LYGDGTTRAVFAFDTNADGAAVTPAGSFFIGGPNAVYIPGGAEITVNPGKKNEKTEEYPVKEVAGNADDYAGYDGIDVSGLPDGTDGADSAAVDVDGLIIADNGLAVAEDESGQWELIGRDSDDDTFSQLPERLFGKDVTVGEDYIGSLAAAYKELLDKQRAVLEGGDSLAPDEYQAVIDEFQAIIDAIQAEIDWLGQAVEDLDKLKGEAENAKQDAEDARAQEPSDEENTGGDSSNGNGASNSGGGSTSSGGGGTASPPSGGSTPPASGGSDTTSPPQAETPPPAKATIPDGYFSGDYGWHIRIANNVIYFHPGTRPDGGEYDTAAYWDLQYGGAVLSGKSYDECNVIAETLFGYINSKNNTFVRGYLSHFSEYGYTATGVKDLWTIALVVE